MAEYKLFTTSKRHNSTLTPSGGTSDTLVLKQGCSLIRPTFMLAMDSRPDYSMLEFEGRYYFITDIKSVRNNLWELTCEIDVLSTYKNEILAASAFILYDTAANTELPDSRLSKKTTETVQIASAAFQALGHMYSVGYGTVVLGILTGDGVKYYAMYPSTAAQLLDHINSTDIPSVIDATLASGFNDYGEAIMNLAQNFGFAITQWIGSGTAASCIISSRMVAVGLGAFSGTSETVYLGTYNTGVTALAIDGIRIGLDSVTIPIPWTYSDWRRNSPYTEHYFYSPFIGAVHLPASELIGASAIDAQVQFDCISGDILAELAAVHGSDRRVIGVYRGSIAAEYAVGSSNTPISQQLSGIGAAVAGVAGVAAATTGLGAIVSGTAAIAGLNLVNTPVPTSISGGGGGAALGCDPKCYVYEITHDTNVAPDSVSSVMGTPTMAVKALSGMSGYVETRNFSVSGNMTDQERQMINQLMDGGVYIE